jgi:hypothetical protein
MNFSFQSNERVRTMTSVIIICLDFNEKSVFAFVGAFYLCGLFSPADLSAARALIS